MIDTQTVLSLLRASLCGTPTAIGPNISVEEYLAFARVQQIEALLITGMHKSGVPITKEVRNILLRATLLSNRQVDTAKSLYALFEANKIDYIPLKGCVLKVLYPSEELRSMGDIDMLVRAEQYERIRPLMLSLGCKEGVQSDHEYIWDKDGIHIELHKRLIPSYNKDYYAYYGDGWQLAKPADTPHRYEMSPEDSLVYLFTHYAKHYRDAGVGIRQALDLYVYRKAHPNLDDAYIAKKMTLLQLNRFYNNTMHMLDVWFADAEHTEASRLISDRLFASGVFGTHADSLQSTMLKKVNHYGAVQEVKLLNWFHRAFPAYSGMRQLYPVLNNYPVLLPVMWVTRWINILLHKRWKFKQYMQEDSTLDEASVKEYHDMLRKSGLDFNFK